MDDLEYVRERLKDRNLKVVAERTGLSYRTIWALRSGKTSPAYNTIRLLKEYLREGAQPGN